jgi:quercetin dioxygenase-like cupin family protein
MTQDSYFEMGTGDPTTERTPGRYIHVNTIDPIEFAKGLAFRPVLGQRLLVNFVRFEPNTVAPVHAHEEEQVACVIEGEFEFDLDGDVRIMGPGDVVHVPPFVPHGARTIGSSCFEIDVFSPPRRALLEAAGLLPRTEPPPAEP